MRQTASSERTRAIYFDWLSAIGAIVLLLIVAQPVKAESGPENTDRQCTVLKALVVLVQFPDIERTIEAEFAKRRFFQGLDGYVREMSYGRFCIGGDVTERWYVLPCSISEYRVSPRNLEVDKTRVRRLVRDTLDAVDQDVDFSRYDFIAFFMAVKRKDYGMIGMCAYPGMLGWRSTKILETRSGQKINRGIALFTYQAHLGTLFHDVAHVLGGVQEGKRKVPCLYDHDLQSRPSAPHPHAIRRTFVESTIHMGFWDPMSCHFYRWRQPPPGISSWTKIRLGWLDPSKIKVVNSGESARVLLGPHQFHGYTSISFPPVI